jgi:hypothetical protein
MAGAVVVLLRFPPATGAFYPRCPIYSAFRMQCPGCGGTRALAALLHGHLREALGLNALVALLAPLAVGYGSLFYWRFLRREALRWPQVPQAAIYAGLIVAVLFAVQRNLPAH